MVAINELNLLSADQAEAAFYRAFECCDLEAMMAVWAGDPETVCIHPHGPRLVGKSEIRKSWQQIMAHSPKMRFKITELNTIQTADLAVHLVNESIHIEQDGDAEFTIISTNIYRRTDKGWRMVLHHASPTPESLENIRTTQTGIDETEDEEANHGVTIH